MGILVDGREVPAAPEKNLLEHLLGLGYDLPYFCWHPAMGSVGACRQCAVKQYQNETDTHGRIVMACMTPAADGARIGFDEPEARDFRARVIEWLMTGHPHDCPVCEEGGECHLQDMTVMTGHIYRRYRGKKRTFRNQYLGPLVNHEMNRCIACYRCVRFYQDYAGGDDLRAFGIHGHVFFGRHEDGVLQSPFSGNLAEVCPTGVFTDRPFSEHYVRKWDLQAAPSICVHCGTGCNISAQERYGKLRRIVNRYNGDVNGYFICDRGRYGYGFVNAPERVLTPLARVGEALEPLTAADAIALVTPSLLGGVIGIGSPRASVESNYALRQLVGPGNFYAGVAPREQPALDAALAELRAGVTRVPTLREAAEADAVLVLGEDVSATAPRLALALRQAARSGQLAHAARLKIPHWLDYAVRTAGQGVPGALYVASPLATGLDDAAVATHRAAPAALAALAAAIARQLDAAAPAGEPLDDAAEAFAAAAAAALRRAVRPLVVTGTGAASAALLHAAANVAHASSAARGAPAYFYAALPEANSLGLALLGGEPFDAALARARDSGLRAVVVLENDLERRIGAAAFAELRDRVKKLIVIDHSLTRTAQAADLVLPAAPFAEGDGTLVSSEGRVQRFFQVYPAEAGVRESWRWLAELADARSGNAPWRTLDDIIGAVAADVPELAAIRDAAPSARFRIVSQRIGREPPRYSGRTAVRANVEIREERPPPDVDAPLAFSMEGYHGSRTPPELRPFFWAPGWNSQQSVNKFQDEIGGRLRGGDPGVRLFEPLAGAACTYFDVTPPESWPEGELGVAPIHDVFSDEEQSAASPPIRERAPPPEVRLHRDDAAALRVRDGDRVTVERGGAALTAPARVSASIARGVVGVPACSALWLHEDAASARVRAAAEPQ